MKTLYFVESIYIPGCTDIAYVSLGPVNEEDDILEIETSTDNLVMKGNKKVQEGEYVYYDDKTGQFSTGRRSKKAKELEDEFNAIQAQIIANQMI